MGTVGVFLRPGLVLTFVEDLRPGAALVSLVRESDQAGFLQLTGHAPDPLGLFVVDRAGKGSGDPQDVFVRGGDDLTCIPELAMGAETSDCRSYDLRSFLVQIYRTKRPWAGVRTAVAPPDRTVLLLLALYACWGSAIPAMKLMVKTVPPVGGAALVFLLAGVVLAGASRGRPRPTRVQLRHLAVAGVLLLVGGQGLATVALTTVTASLGAILAAAIPLWVVILSGLTGIRVSVASWARLVAGFSGIVIVVLTAPDSAIGGAPWAVGAFCVAPILWATGSLLTAKVERPIDRVVASAVQLQAGGTVLLLIALSLGELDPTRWSDVSWASAGAAVFLLVFDSLAGFVLYTRLLESAPASLVSTYAYVTPLVGAVIGATVFDESLWAGAFFGGSLVLGAVALELRGR